MSASHIQHSVLCSVCHHNGHSHIFGVCVFVCLSAVDHDKHGNVCFFHPSARRKHTARRTRKKGANYASTTQLTNGAKVRAQCARIFAVSYRHQGVRRTSARARFASFVYGVKGSGIRAAARGNNVILEAFFVCVSGQSPAPKRRRVQSFGRRQRDDTPAQSPSGVMVICSLFRPTQS